MNSDEKCELPECFRAMIEKEEEIKQKIPEALQKAKNIFLVAISKSGKQEFNEEDVQLVEEVMNGLDSSWSLLKRDDSIRWDDTFASNIVNKCLKANALFEINKYLDCARLVFLMYSGITHLNSFKASVYILTHARQYGDTSKTIFQANYDYRDELNQNKDSIPDTKTAALPNSKFMNKIEDLIKDLRSAYDETKFRILNTNATYITLLMLRRLVKNEAECAAALQRIHTHDTYVKLCPWPLDNQLPKSDTSKLYAVDAIIMSACLAVQAYLNTDDELTKKVLRVTCVQYMEWNGLHLPNLFFKVVQLYGIDEGKLFDRLSTDKTAKSLLRLTIEYYEKQKMLENDPTKTQRWLPYCRVIHGNYHKNLSAGKNNIICLVLAHLVDLKIGLDKSNVRLSHWAKSNIPMWKKVCQEYAEKIHKELESSLPATD